MSVPLQKAATAPKLNLPSPLTVCESPTEDRRRWGMVMMDESGRFSSIPPDWPLVDAAGLCPDPCQKAPSPRSFVSLEGNWFTRQDVVLSQEGHRQISQEPEESPTGCLQKSQKLISMHIRDWPTPPSTGPALSPCRASQRPILSVDAGTQTSELISLAIPEPTIRLEIESPILPPTHTPREVQTRNSNILNHATATHGLHLGGEDVRADAISWPKSPLERDRVGENEEASRLKEENADLQARIKLLEARFEVIEFEKKDLQDQVDFHSELLNKKSGDYSNLVNGWIDTMHDRQKLFMDRMSAWEEKRALEKKNSDLQNRNNDLEETVGRQNELLKALMEDMRMSSQDLDMGFSTLSPGFVTAFKRYWSELKQARQLVAKLPLSPRTILLAKLTEAESIPIKDQRKRAKPSNSSNIFDVPLKLEKALAYASALDNYPKGRLDIVSIRVCSLCSLPKLVNAPTADPNAPIFHEFHPRFGKTSCCHQPICSSCLPAAIIKNISANWWHRIGSECWINCPVPTCTSQLPVHYNVDLTNMLRSLGDEKVLAHVQLFDRAKSLRATLEAVTPAPTPEALKIAESLHAKLIRHKKMHPIFSSRALLAVQMLPVDTPDGERTISVPIFTSLFKRTEALRDCAVCAEGIRDVDVESEQAWSRACKGFAGDWTWHVRAFPTKSLLPACAAKHDLDICRGCLARHLASKLEDMGRAGADSLPCPSPKCGHIYTHAEVKALAMPETFAQYDKLRLLGHLATLPNFRWCLREGCQAGQIYDTLPDGSTLFWRDPSTPPTRNKIYCQDCSFEMCFLHQMPWHGNLSCEAYTSSQRPENKATTEWLARNAKKCPGRGCEVFVEKKGGCFHMTCRQCNHEFCWECLADWRGVFRAGRYDRSGHNEGCFFRDATAPRPTEIMGDTVQVAMDRRR